MKMFLGEVEMSALDQPYRHFDRQNEYPEVEAIDEEEARKKLNSSYLHTGVVKRVWEL